MLVIVRLLVRDYNTRQKRIPEKQALLSIMASDEWRDTLYCVCVGLMALMVLCNVVLLLQGHL